MIEGLIGLRVWCTVVVLSEDRRALALNDRVFANTTFRPARDIPSGGRISPRIVPLGPMTLPGHPDFYPAVRTDGGEYLESRAVNVIQGEIKPSTGPGITYDPDNMWHSKPLPGGKALLEIAFPFPIDADEVAIHTQHSGLHHEVSVMRLESLDEAGTPAVLADQPVDSTDEIVTFRPTRNPQVAPHAAHRQDFDDRFAGLGIPKIGKADRSPFDPPSSRRCAQQVTHWWNASPLRPSPVPSVAACVGSWL